MTILKGFSQFLHSDSKSKQRLLIGTLETVEHCDLLLVMPLISTLAYLLTYLYVCIFYCTRFWLPVLESLIHIHTYIVLLCL